MSWPFSSPRGTSVCGRGLGLRFLCSLEMPGEAGSRGRPAEGVLGGQSPHLSVADFGTRGHLIRADGGGLSPRKLVPPTRARVPSLYTID